MLQAIGPPASLLAAHRQVFSGPLPITQAPGLWGLATPQPCLSGHRMATTSKTTFKMRRNTLSVLDTLANLRIRRKR